MNTHKPNAFEIAARREQQHQAQNQSRQCQQQDKQCQQQHRQSQQQDRQCQEQARKIANAFRSVEQIKVMRNGAESSKNSKNMNNVNSNTNNVNSKQQISVKSSYASKVKQTLREINANKTKEMQMIKKTNTNGDYGNVNSNNNGNSNKNYKETSQEEIKLKRAASNHMFEIMVQASASRHKFAFTKIQKQSKAIEKGELLFLRKIRLNKLFQAWKYETVLIKLAKERKSKELEQVKTNTKIEEDQSHNSMDSKSKQDKAAEQANQMALQFRKYTLIRNCVRAWSKMAKKSLRKKKAEVDKVRVELEQSISTNVKHSNTNTNNTQLHGKLRGFLDNLRDKVQNKDRQKIDRQNKDRLKTIKQKTEQSEIRLIRQQEQQQQDNTNQQHIEEHSQQNNVQQNNQHSNQNQHNHNNAQPYRQYKLSNQQLQKRRQELQHKYKSRKEVLQKLKNEKQRRRKEEERLRIQAEQLIQLEQKKIKQEQYRAFLRNKQEQQQWQMREKQLLVRAQQFNRVRLLKYYAWIHIYRIKQQKTRNINSLGTKLNRILMRYNFNKFIDGVEEAYKKIMGEMYARMERIYNIRLMSRAIKGLKDMTEQQLELKQELIARHQINTTKMYFKQWQRLLPILNKENYEWERPRNKKAQQFRYYQLKSKALDGLRQNKQELKKQKNIQVHKQNIKQKIHSLLESQQEINYQDYL